jgi:predicted phosphodiesterase
MIWLLGDVHSHFDHIEQAIDAAPVKPSTTIFLGDIEAPIPFEDCIEGILKRGVEVFWIRGNHDTDTKDNWNYLSSPESMARNIDGKVINVDGIWIAGLGGVFRGEAWHEGIEGGRPSFASYAEYEKAIRNERNLKQRLSRQDLVQMQAVPSRQGAADLQDTYRAGKLLKHHSTIFPDAYGELALLKADILVTHEAASCHPHGFGAIDVLARKMGVKALFHGHQHDCLDYSLAFDPMGFRAYGVGFCGISSWDPMTGRAEVVMPGDFDEARRSCLIA